VLFDPENHHCETMLSDVRVVSSWIDFENYLL
jgi:hypothetical protein